MEKGDHEPTSAPQDSGSAHLEKTEASAHAVNVSTCRRCGMLGPVIQRLFVYGTLAPGRPNEHVLADLDGEWEPASVKGRLVQEGWGWEHGYPAISVDTDDGRVDGLLFSSEQLADHWARLDEFEGIGYERVTVLAESKDGPVEAHVYVAAP